ncbi:MAG TPA: Type 1 glutamine amidotransferase-like domain-containing protein [Anaerolineae bacterium]|nr:Type 1 glutamine amidotransferase-like domain-containing protein [Anaerolineae bacterium]
MILEPHLEGAHLALIGGEEFADGFEEVHAELLAGLGEGQRRVVYLPTCAADDGPETIDYWRREAVQRLSALGAAVETPRIVDVDSANDERYAQMIAEADWIYLGGGYPHVALRILPGTRALAALSAAVARGVLVSGASGGAMLMCARSIVITPEFADTVGGYWETGVPEDWDPPPPPSIDCLGWIPRSECAPHFNRRLLPKRWREGKLLPEGFSLIGIDEQTALIPRGARSWEVRGRGLVTLIRAGSQPMIYRAGEQVKFSQI